MEAIPPLDAIPPRASHERLYRPSVPLGDPAHRAAGDACLEALLAGTDEEGFAGDRLLAAAARDALASAWGVEAGVVEAYRLRNADRVEVVFAPEGARPRAMGGVPGSWFEGVAWAVEVTRADDLAFRASPFFRRADAAGWLLVDPGDVAAVARAAGRAAMLSAQAAAIARGIALAAEARAASGARATLDVDVSAALRATSLPFSVRVEAAAGLGTEAPLGAVVAGLARVAAGRDREEGEAYARGAGRLLVRAAVAPAGETPAVPANRPA